MTDVMELPALSLVELVSLDEDCGEMAGCEFDHSANDGSFAYSWVPSACQHVAVAGFRWCLSGVAVLVCSSVVDAVRREMSFSGPVCVECNRPVAECWRIIPV